MCILVNGESVCLDYCIGVRNCVPKLSDELPLNPRPMALYRIGMRHDDDFRPIIIGLVFDHEGIAKVDK
jgi:hypothetical protein